MKLYVIDDDLVELELWLFTVAHNRPDWIIQTFTTVDELCAAIQANEPDVAVVDLVMPLTPGYVVCEKLRDNYPNIKTVVCSAKEGEQYRVLAESCGAIFISKTIKHFDRLKEIEDYARA